MARITITGGTGLIGRELSRKLKLAGHQLVILTRSMPEKPAEPGTRFALWDPQAGTIDAEAVTGSDYIIHLAGAGVADKRWTKKRKQEILDSRVQSGQLLVRTLLENPNRVKALISASAIGWYGADPRIPNPDPFDETDPAAGDFLGQTCLAWEQSLDGLSGSPVRVVKLRTGIVLSEQGGALAEFSKPLKAGVATILGSGKQVLSWIHLDDIVRLYITAIADEGYRGVYNAVAPVPVNNKTLILTLAKEQRKNFYIPVHVPAFALKIAMGEMSTEVLKSTTVSCDKLHAAGFTFLYPTIEAALKQKKS